MTIELCSIAVENNSIAFKYVPDALKYVQNKFITEELCTFAIENYNAALKYIPDEFMTKELCTFAVKKS